MSSSRRHRGCGRARRPPRRRRAARATSSRPCRSSDSSSAGARQPLFADEPPRVAALAREDQRRNARTRSRRCCAGSARARCSRCGIGSASCEMPVTVLAGERDEKFRGDRPPDGRTLLPDGGLVIVPGGPRPAAGDSGAAVAAQLGGTSAIASGSCRSLVPTQSERLDAQPRARAAARSPRRGGQRVLEPREQPERRQPAVAAAARARGERGGGVQRSGHAQRAVERRGEVHLGAGRAHQRRGRQQAGDARRSARSSGRPRRRRPRRQRAVLGRRSRRSPRAPPRARAPRASPRSPCVGSSTSSRPAAASDSIAAHRLLDVPRAVGVERAAPSAGRPRRARPPARPASSPTPTFSLTHVKPARAAAAACRRRPRGPAPSASR